MESFLENLLLLLGVGSVSLAAAGVAAAVCDWLEQHWPLD